MKRMGILGPQGTHSEAAALYLNRLLPEPRELVICSEIYEVLQMVEDGLLDSGFVPVENSLEGSINITLDTLARSDVLEVARELIWPIHNHLMSKCDAGDIRRIYSHAQPISQCRTHLRTHYPKAEIHTTPSTARAAEIVGEAPPDSGWAAICTRRAGELHGLSVIATEIQDNLANSTRFFEVQRRTQMKGSRYGDKVLIICQIDGKQAGSLCAVLEEFAFRGVNMTRIESRPARTELGAYIFFFDLETDAPRKQLEESIEAVRKRSIWLRNLGEFSVLSAKATD